jgi:hypothetical protein
MNLLSKLTKTIVLLLTIFSCGAKIKSANTESVNNSVTIKTAVVDVQSQQNQHKPENSPNEINQEINQLKVVLNYYFELKDALVKSDGKAASAIAEKLLISYKAVQMNKLTNEEHTVWMKVMKDLAFDTEHIEETKDVKHQREHFNTLSDNMYLLLKVSKQETATYYQHCPMANKGKGANWLSKENSIKNPYFGAQMLNCGKTIETIK